MDATLSDVTKTIQIEDSTIRTIHQMNPEQKNVHYLKYHSMKKSGKLDKKPYLICYEKERKNVRLSAITVEKLVPERNAVRRHIISPRYLNSQE